MNYKIKSRIWIELDGKVLLGEGRVRLLKTINETGSLSKAAKKLKISYKKAWTLVDAVNKTAIEPIVSTNIGGKNGGGTQLTPYGEKMIETFELITKNCWQHLDKQQASLNN